VPALGGVQDSPVLSLACLLSFVANCYGRERAFRTAPLVCQLFVAAAAGGVRCLRSWCSLAQMRMSLKVKALEYAMPVGQRVHVKVGWVHPARLQVACPSVSVNLESVDAFGLINSHRGFRPKNPSPWQWCMWCCQWCLRGSDSLQAQQHRC